MKANLLNDTFSKVFPKDDTHSFVSSLSTSSHIVPQQKICISKQVILQAIQRMKKSVSLNQSDSVLSYYIHKTSSQLLNPFYINFSLSMTTKKLLKKAIFVPIKKTKRNLMWNFKSLPQKLRSVKAVFL